MPSTCAIGSAAEVTRPAAVVRTAGAPISSTVPHAWHSGQRPSHFTVVQPHSVQRKDGRSLADEREVRAAMPPTVTGAADNAARAAARAGAPPGFAERQGSGQRDGDLFTRKG
ncbi:hypothetical protein GCM10010302_74350 [Streptomyces polychromogenes]|uniref:Uncharacterized protein n=1 Tax=Streptomyces polychromogenes TaxID=67342 RepID=A0ABP3FVP7_9ACTN